MPRILLQGRRTHQLRSLHALLRTCADVLWRRALRRPLVREWSASFEIGTLFYRRQFDRAFALPDIAQGRAYFDSLCTVAEPNEGVEVRPAAPGEPRGDWFLPRDAQQEATLLYFHGGGYAFHAAVSRHFVAMLARLLRVRIFALDYRLTPEHPHPAQVDDALAACRHLLASGQSPSRLVLAGDSAGGHLALMTLVRLREAGLPQPALALALSPWTDVGRGGAGVFANDRYDMVQGYQTAQYASWLRGGAALSDEELSPIAQDLRGLAPIYLQAGEKEILVDQIRDFARIAARQGARVRLDVWPHMTHEFHAYGSTLSESRDAVARLRQAIDWALAPAGTVRFEALPLTEVDHWE